MRYAHKSESSSPIIKQTGLFMMLDPNVFRDSVEHCVCFTGHRSIAEDERFTVSLRLDHVLSILHDKGYTTFITGGALGFDTLAAEAVLRLREFNKDVQLILVIPCKSQAAKWQYEDKSTYESILNRADKAILLSRHYYTGCMQVRNRFMVNHASFVVSYLKELTGGTYATVSYAMKNNRQILNIAMSDECLAFCVNSQALSAGG